MKEQQSQVFVFVAYLTIPAAARSTSPDMTIVFYVWSYGRFIEIQSNYHPARILLIVFKIYEKILKQMTISQNIIVVLEKATVKIIIW